MLAQRPVAGRCASRTRSPRRSTTAASWTSTASGFVANWLSEWYAYHPVVKEKLGLKASERIAGFIYIGTARDELEERPRPEMDKIVIRF